MHINFMPQATAVYPGYSYDNIILENDAILTFILITINSLDVKKKPKAKHNNR